MNPNQKNIFNQGINNENNIFSIKELTLNDKLGNLQNVDIPYINNNVEPELLNQREKINNNILEGNEYLNNGLDEMNENEIINQDKNNENINNPDYLPLDDNNKINGNIENENNQDVNIEFLDNQNEIEQITMSL